MIKLENLKKTYNPGKIEVHALDNVSINIEEGEFLTVHGPSGSGKTTLLNILGCLDIATSGDYYFKERDVSKLSMSDLSNIRRINIGFIFQTYNLIPVLTAYENVELSLMLAHSKYKKEDILNAMDDVGIKDLAKRFPREMSGGQQQRVSIARALVKSPKLILADEPTANLDSENATMIMEAMKEMNEKYNVTFVFSTHDPLVMSFAKRLIKLKDGKIETDERK
ncbi:lipoprotein-releasing system ATP-binding protein LolD [candidate division TA06 bacterium]|uniref:Lipoprotein-releasing system ATP-binding protein LolD n=1 Tax=candidate division TA06 bacterium TaxID=2250710 RepID=A0A660SNC1_UNCT6|nr:MAG: lipoprotein-releasing system ATP-binding protein LolD [candidate division TA06 bacterium]